MHFIGKETKYRLHHHAKKRFGEKLREMLRKKKQEQEKKWREQEEAEKMESGPQASTAEESSPIDVRDEPTSVELPT